MGKLVAWVFLLLTFFIFVFCETATTLHSDVLELAAQGNLKQLVDLLSEYPTAVHYTTDRGFTPLIMASANGHKTVVEYLLSLGASPNEIESDQWSPLMFAAYQGYTEVALALFTAGANPLLKNNNHLTAHELGINRGNYDTAGIIGEETLRYAISLGSVDDVLRCVRLGVNPNLQNSVGWTALMVTSSNQAVEATRELINLGADVNLEEQDGWTPLMFTAHNGNVEVAELLIQAGADRSHETKNHDNPLQHAVARNQQRLVEYLRKDSTLGQSTMSSIPSEYQVDPTLQPVDSAPIEPADSSIIGKTLKKKKFFGLF